MDTEISYKYKDGLHPDIKEGHLTIAKDFYTEYLDLYNKKNIIAHKFSHVGLRSWGDDCKSFMS